MAQLLTSTSSNTRATYVGTHVLGGFTLIVLRYLLPGIWDRKKKDEEPAQSPESLGVSSMDTHTVESSMVQTTNPCNNSYRSLLAGSVPR